MKTTLKTNDVNQLANNSQIKNFYPISILFDDFFAPINEKDTYSPQVNIQESNDDYLIELAVPGMNKSDFKIELDDKLLKVSSNKSIETDEKESNYTIKEFSYMNFYRSFRLPDLVNKDEISVKYQDGILRVYIPKLEEAKKEVKLLSIS